MENAAAANPSRKVCLITGATSGIGLEIARGMAREGFHVILAGRDREKLANATAEIAAGAGAVTVEAHAFDLSKMAGVRGLARAVLENHDRLDVLVNNVGAVFPARELTVDGFEKTWALNHFGPFLLTSLLMPLFVGAHSARIINLASDAHLGAKIDFSNIDGQRGYRSFSTYQRTKLANVMFTISLAEWLNATRVTANAMHPGLVASNFQLGLSPWIRPFAALIRPMMRSTAEGADTAIYLATSPEVASLSGKYFDRREITRHNPVADDTQARDRLWRISVERTGARY